MRVLLTTQPAYGHFHPMVPFAAALQDAGHDVRFATGARFCEVVRAAGFDCDPAGMDWLEADKSGMPQHLKPSPGCTIEEYFTQQFVTATAAPLARDVVLLAQVWTPSVIVRERTEFGGAIGAEALGIPAAAVQVGSSNLFTPALSRTIEPAYNRARAEFALGPDTNLAALETQMVFSSAPPQLHDVAIPLPPNLASFRPSVLDRAHHDELPDWARGLGVKRPLVYATLGTVFNNPAFELPFFPAVMTGLEDEDVDVVITVGPNVDPNTLGPAPQNVHVTVRVTKSPLPPVRCDCLPRRSRHTARRDRTRSPARRSPVRRRSASQRRHSDEARYRRSGRRKPAHAGNVADSCTRPHRRLDIEEQHHAAPRSTE